MPLVVHWPEGLGDVGGELRHQFHHVNDIAPTIYEACGVTPKDTYGGREQMPISGTSLGYTFTGTDEPSRKGVQYFEMLSLIHI